jgi:hypothetical protein
VVQHIESCRVPGIDNATGSRRAGFPAGKSRHGDHTIVPELAGEPDRAPDVLGMFVADHIVRMQRISVAVQHGDRYSCAFEKREKVVARSVARKNDLEGGDVDGWEESARIVLYTGEA